MRINPIRCIDVVVIGAGQAGLAISSCLTACNIEHVVLDSGRIGERWRSERWGSLRLLTPNWMTRLPRGGYRGQDPHGFMTMQETVRFLEDYARGISAPVQCGAHVMSASRAGGKYHVLTNQGEWSTRAMIIATGANQIPYVPSMATSISPRISQVAPRDYRHADHLPDGGVLVVGASSTGVQLAEEIHASGRPVTLSIGQHTRVPRCYRGRDILWWLDRLGSLTRSAAEMRDAADFKEPSLQLIGSCDYRSIDLAVLRDMGIRILGRASDASGSCVHFEGDLAMTTGMADRRLTRILSGIDAAIETGVYGQVDEDETVRPVLLDADPVELDLTREGINTVVWATGYRRSYPWLNIPILDARGEIVNNGGICPLPGLYALGLNFMRRRNSSFIDGVGRDAEELAVHICGHLADQTGIAAETTKTNSSAAFV